MLLFFKLLCIMVIKNQTSARGNLEISSLKRNNTHILREVNKKSMDLCGKVLLYGVSNKSKRTCSKVLIVM
jgi:hypothetical protein